MRVLNVITGLNQGGAERQLTNFVTTTSQDMAIFSILSPGIMASEIESAGVSICSGLASRKLSLGWLSKLRSQIFAYQPDVVMGWMYHGNIAASMTRVLGYHGPIVWNIRHSLHHLSLDKRTTRWAISACALVSWQPTRILYNSSTSMRQHEDLGYRRNRSMVIHNGFDLKRFKPDASARSRFRQKIGVADDQILIGVVGRVHATKNQIAWVAAYRHLTEMGFSGRCVLIGQGVDERGTPLDQAIKAAYLEHEIIRLPPTQHLEKVYPGLDLLVMPSLSEGFPNVVGEAMACGVPAVVTPVGDAPYLVDDTGFVCQSTDAVDIIDGITRALSCGRQGLEEFGFRARSRMEIHFGLERAAGIYEDLLQKLTQ